MEFNYYYGSEADQFSFIRIPKSILIDETFATLSMGAKLLYGLLLDRMGLSMKNKWLDEENRVYIIYQIAEIQEDLGLSKKKAIDYLGELEKFGLVEKKRRGLGLPSILYVKSFITMQDSSSDSDSIHDDSSRSDEIRTSAGSSDSDENVSIGTENGPMAENDPVGKASIDEMDSGISGYDSRGVDSGTSRGTHMGTSRSVDLGTSRGAISELQEVPKRAPLNNKTKTNNNYRSDTESNPILSAPRAEFDAIDEMRAYAQIIKENIEYDSLMAIYPRDAETVDGLFDIILETVLSKSDTILVAGSPYPKELVKSKLLKLNFSHLQYVMECFLKNTTKVANIKKYMLAMLFNAPSTIGSYYQAEVNHDMPQFVKV